MGTRHKHYDVIVAWAAGEEIEFKTSDQCFWRPVEWANPVWFEGYEYRIKPKIIKREGWVNVYPSHSYTAYANYVYATKEEADLHTMTGRKACIRIEWDEEV